MGSLRRVIRKLKLRLVLNIILLVFATTTLVFSIYNLAFWAKTYPNIRVAGVDVSNLDPKASAELLSQKIQVPKKIQLINQGQSFDLETKDIDLFYNFSEEANKAFNLVRTDNITNDLISRIKLLLHPVDLGLDVKLDNAKLTKFISVIAGQNSQDPIDPTIKLVGGIIVVSNGRAGYEVDQDSLRSKILNELSYAKSLDIQIPIISVDNSLTDSEAEAAKTRAEKYVGKSVTANFESNSFTIPDTDILNLLNLKGGFNKAKIETYLNKIVVKVNRDPQNPKFTFDGVRVTEFQPAEDGIRVDINDFTDNLVSTLEQLESGTDKEIALNIPVIKTPPDVTTDKVNNLGIKELLGRGTSTYFHSIPGRVHNVILAASRINGTLVKPGDTFSFNDTLGDVSAFTGYQQAYIISGGKTILGDGGGVCQVSTTLFRAILKAGLPVTERAAHAYRVGYYEQDSPPGLDATVYGPSPDLKFINDTPGYILIEAIADPKNYALAFELYGTSDGRVASITKPVVTNITPALPTVYQDDPALPAGTLKQTDFSAAGATVTFKYSVIRGGETILQKTFVSNYRPWAAVFLRGTGPAI